MDILYSDGNVERLCRDDKQARRKLGAAGQKRLTSRLADLDAAERLGEVIAGSPHPLKGDRKGQYSFTLDGGRRLVLEPADSPLPLDRDGEIDWPNVRSVRVVLIGDYHD